MSYRKEARRLVAWAVITGGLVVVCAVPTSAQALRGAVRAAETNSPVPGARIFWRGAGKSESVLTDSIGGFVVALPEPGAYQLQVEALGFLSSGWKEVVADNRRGMVQVDIVLTTSPLEIGGITVVARGLDLRHRASLAGFHERYKTRLRVGSVRQIGADDPELATATNVRDALQWLPMGRAKCLVAYLDGVSQTPTAADLGRLSTLDIAGIEFYASQLDAPLELRDNGRPCLNRSDWGVVAIWTKRDRRDGLD